MINSHWNRIANEDIKKLWRWNFTGKGFSDSCESAVGCK